MTRATSRQRLSILAVLASMALVVLDAGITNVALPSIAKALGEEPARSVHIVNAYQLALVMGLLPSAHIAEWLGYRRIFVIGVAIFACASVLCALAPTLPLLVAARFIQGLGGAAIMALGVALLRFALGPDRLGAAIGWNALTVALCSAGAPAVGAALLSVVSWPWLFLINLPVALGALLAASALPKVSPQSSSIDLSSIGLLAATAALVVVAAELAMANPLLSAALMGTGFSCLGLLIRRERGKAAPLLPLDLLARRSFRTSAASSVLVFAGQSAGLVALPFYLQLGLGRSALTAGLMISLWPLAVAGSSAVANRLGNVFAWSSVCTIGAGLLAFGLAASAAWPLGKTILPLAACLILCGVGFGLFQVPNNRNLFMAAPAGRSAAAGGMQGTARLSGQTIGALVIGACLSGGATAGPRLAMGIGAAAALVGGCISWFGRAKPVDVAHKTVCIDEAAMTPGAARCDALAAAR